MASFDQKFPFFNTRYAGLVLGLQWLKRERLLRFLNRIPLKMKTVKRTPRSKLEDLLVCLMAGIESLGAIGPGLRRDEGLKKVLGRESLAEQSLMSQTLDVFDSESLERLRSNIVSLLTDRSRTLARIRRGWITVLDLDMTDLPCSRRCQGAVKGRTTGKRGKTVRQLSVIYNFRHREPLDVFLHPGNTYCAGPLEKIVLYLEQCYDWDRSVRQKICWRLDSGYGSDQKLSWLMRRGYQVLAKGFSSRRATNWGRAVAEAQWRSLNPTQDIFERPRIPQLKSPHRCFLIRTLRSKEKGYRYSYLASNLKKWILPTGHVSFYNDRQGGEKEIQQLKSVLGLKHKRKRSFHGMEALALLTLMANLCLVWYRHELGLDQLGLKRLIRDVIKTSGIVHSGRLGLRLIIDAQSTYFKELNQWRPQIELPLFFSKSGTILYKI